MHKLIELIKAQSAALVDIEVSEDTLDLFKHQRGLNLSECLHQLFDGNLSGVIDIASSVQVLSVHVLLLKDLDDLLDHLVLELSLHATFGAEVRLHVQVKSLQSVTEFGVSNLIVKALVKEQKESLNL